ncbi:MAG: nucleolar protein 56 [archaeon GW2011_AR5]|nr:MAG: nucleolar protein 56 [archaeon GW2011_AR5]
MKALVARSPAGFFAFSENGELLYYKLWNQKTALEKFASRELDRDFIAGLSGYTLEESPKAYGFLRKNFREYAKTLGFAKDDGELNEFLSGFSIGLSKRNLMGTIGRDRLVVQSVRSLDDISRAVNVFLERLYEWFSLHYPEMKNASVKDIVLKHGRRDNIPGFKSSTGVDLGEEDEKAVAEFAKAIDGLEKEKKLLEKYVSSAMKEIAPNFAALVDPLLGARIVAAAGSLEKLARMPASTIQLLGAEKALFRHLHQKGKSPKYGIIYNSPLVQNAGEHKGKVARILSSKLMLAARIDYYSGRDESEKLKRELDEEIRKVKI